jgi:hypothetical protein
LGDNSGGVAQIGEDGEHAPVGIGIGVEAEFEEDLLDVGLNGAFSDKQAGGGGPVGQSLGDQGEHLTLAFGEFFERVGTAFAGE